MCQFEKPAGPREMSSRIRRRQKRFEWPICSWGVFLMTTNITIIPDRCMFSVNTEHVFMYYIIWFISQEIEQSERASSWMEWATEASVAVQQNWALWSKWEEWATRANGHSERPIVLRKKRFSVTVATGPTTNHPHSITFYRKGKECGHRSWWSIWSKRFWPENVGQIWFVGKHLFFRYATP